MLPAFSSGHRETARVLAQKVREFVDEIIIPNEPQLSRPGAQALQLQSDLALEARQAGLYGLFYPLSHGGKLPLWKIICWLRNRRDAQNFPRRSLPVIPPSMRICCRDSETQSSGSSFCNRWQTGRHYPAMA